jgi:hypothetical protein
MGDLLSWISSWMIAIVLMVWQAPGKTWSWCRSRGTRAT